MAKNKRLKKAFPFRDIFRGFLKEYSKCSTYWYVPKARSIRDKNSLSDIRASLKIIFDKFLDSIWNQKTQNSLLEEFKRQNILEPYKTKGVKADRTALVRIHKKLWEVLGLLWVEENNSVVITDAGLDVLSAKSDEEAYPVIEAQIAKWQYPNPSVEHSDSFKGIAPHLFLLQVLQRVDYKITREEFDLFVNLGQGHDDLERIVRYVKSWRDLDETQQNALLDIVKDIPFRQRAQKQQTFWDDDEEFAEVRPTRFRRVNLNSAYQRAFYSCPSYLKIEDNGDITCVSDKEINNLVENKLKSFKLSIFKNKADWFAYFGNPKQQPSWFTYLSLAVERASSRKEARAIVNQGREQIPPEQLVELERQEIEKGIEDFYVNRLGLIEEGLQLVKIGNESGRQYSTPIGLIDLLCKSKKDDKYVVIEIKAIEARDSVFGQILRYIGWVHRNLERGGNNVRGIILAKEFPESARYSRIGLEPLNPSYKNFLAFKKHGLDLQNS